MRVVIICIYIYMAEADKAKTAFVTSEGLYQFTVLPFGMVNGPAIFSRLMRSVLAGLDNVVNYIDDILVYTEIWDEHLVVLERVMSRLAKAGLTAKPSKCHVGFQTLDFLGHVVGGGTLRPHPEKLEKIMHAAQPTTKREVRAFLGLARYYRKLVGGGTLRPHPEKLEKIMHAAQPTTKREVRAFLGLARYYRKFIPNFATVAAPLSDLTKANTPNKVTWGPLEERAFPTLKSRLTSSPILQKFDVFLYGREFELEVDHRPLMYLAQARLHNSRVLR